MKYNILMIGILVVLASCSGSTSQNSTYIDSTEQTQEEHSFEMPDPNLVSREHSDYDQKTSVTYKGVHTDKGIYVSASYCLNEADMITKEKLSTPQVDDLQLCMVVSKKGATNIDRVEVGVGAEQYTMVPNFKQSKVSGLFTLLFNISTMNGNNDVPEKLSTTERAYITVVFNNGSEKYELTKEDLLPVRTIYNSYILDCTKYKSI